MSSEPKRSASRASSPSGDTALPERALARRETADLEEMLAISGDPRPADWDTDPDNPRSWTTGKKWSMAGIVACYTLVTPLASSMLAPGLKEMGSHFKTSNPSLIAMILCIFVLGFAVGPMLFGPLSEIYGRTWVLHMSMVFFFVFNTASIWAPNLTAILLFRFFAGLGGSAPVAIGGGSIADLFHPDERAGAMGIYSLGPLLGPVIGPVAGGFVVDTIGFKYVFVIVSAVAGLSLIVGIPVLRETYAPVIIERRTRKRAVDAEARGEKFDKLPAPPSLKSVFWVTFSRPFLLLTRSITCFMLSLYTALLYGYLYLMLTTFPLLFQTVYGWRAGISGLAYLGLGLGFVLAALGGSPVMNKIYLTLQERNGGKASPEFRIPGMILGSILVPIGLFWYGWSADQRAQFILPMVGTAIFGLGLMLVFIPIQLYLVDTFTYAASSIAAASLLRSVFGFAFPLFGQQMFAALGTGGGNSLLGGLAIVLGIPFPLYLYFYGEQVRSRDKYTQR